MKLKAVFYDRDGVVIVDKHYLSDPNQIEYTETFFEAYKIVQDLGYEQFMVTNQSGIGRGFFTLEDMHSVHHQIQRDLINRGLKPFKEIAYCPHHPDENCECRKPKPQMAINLIQKWNIDVENSFMLGDKFSDIEMANNAKLKPIGINLYQLTSTPNFKNVLDFANHLLTLTH